MNEEQIKYYNLTKVTKRDLDEGVWDAEHKGLYSKDGKRFLLYKRPYEHIHSGKFDHFTFKSGVEVICEKAFEHGALLEGFKLPDTVVAIGEHALAHVMRFGERIVLPKTLQFIGQHIFGYSEGIFEVEFEEGLQKVDMGDILDFGANTTVYIPSTMTTIGDNGFGKTNSSAGIHVSKMSKSFCVEDDVLYDYNKTKLLRCPITKRGKLVVPEGVTSIGKYAFRICGIDVDYSTERVPKMSVVLPKSLKCIEKGAFKDAHIHSLYIGENVSVIEEQAFEGYFAKDVIVSPKNPYYESCHGMLIDKRTMKLITISGSFTGKDINHKWFEVKNNVLIDKNRKTVLMAIGYSGCNAFLSPTYDTETMPVNSSRDLIVPKGVEAIKGDAFSYCQLNSLTIPEGVTYIGTGAFRYMIVQSISLPSTLCSEILSQIKSINGGVSLSDELTFYVPKGTKKKFLKMSFNPSHLENFIKEIGCEDGVSMSVETEEDDFDSLACVTNEDFKQSFVDKHQVRYSKDMKRLLKFEGFHSHFSTYWVEEGTEIICKEATTSDRYQYVRTFVVPKSVKYIGCCPSIDRLLICGDKVRFSPSIISLGENDTVYIPCGTWTHYYNELEKARIEIKRDDDKDYRLVELSRASVAMYLEQQERTLTNIIKTRKLVSEITVDSINGDIEKIYICYRDKKRVFFLNADDGYLSRDIIHKILSVLGMSYRDIMDILKIDIYEVDVNEENRIFLEGQILASDVIYSYSTPVDFLDKDTDNVATIEWNEKMYESGNYLRKEDVQELLNRKIPMVSVILNEVSPELFFTFFWDYKERPLSQMTSNSILRQLFPHKRPNDITQEEKKVMAYNLIILVKGFIDHYGKVEDVLLPFKTKDDDMHNAISDEEERLVLLISDYYKQMIDKVRGCESETDVVPLFPETQNVQMLKDYLQSHHVNENLINSIVAPAINVIQIE